MITIGQLARYAGVSVKTVRVYHAKGLLPEPERDSAGYRRYTAADATALIKARTLAEAGVPLARIRDLMSADTEAFTTAIAQIDAQLATRIEGIRATRAKLRALATTSHRLLPRPVADHVELLQALGLSQRWIEMVSGLWILAFAAHPEIAPELLRDQEQMLTDPELGQIFRDYDGAFDLDPHDPAVDDVAHRMARATRLRYASTVPLPGAALASDVPGLIQDTVNGASPAWRRIDALVRAELAESRS